MTSGPGFKERLRFGLARKRSMLRVFVGRIWNSPERSIRERLFQSLSDAQDGDFLYVNRGPERYLIHRKDKVIGREVFLSGQFDYDKVIAVQRLLAEHTGKERIDVLVDVGANIGTVCVPAVARGLARRGIAIEPDPINTKLLRINLVLNDLDANVIVHQCAVGEQDNATLVLEQCGDNWGDHRISVSAGDGQFGEAQRRRIEVPSCRLDTLVQPPESGTTMLIWMDTQGYEGFVLKGATSLLAARVPLVAEFWPYGMKRAGSFEPFMSTLAHYRGFVDLGADEITRRALRPMSELNALFARLETDNDAYTDLLII